MIYKLIKLSQIGNQLYQQSVGTQAVYNKTKNLYKSILATNYEQRYGEQWHSRLATTRRATTNTTSVRELNNKQKTKQTIT